MQPAPYLARLAASHTTLAEAFKARGYATMHAGKWHLGPEGSLPEDHGFDVNIAGTERGGPYDLTSDPGETRNLAAENPAKAAELKAKLDAFRKDTAALPPLVNPDAKAGFESW